MDPMRVITTSIEALDGSWRYCYIGCTLGRAPRTKKTLPDFCENMDGTQQCGIKLPKSKMT